MANLPPIPPTREVKSIPALGQPIHIDDLIPGRKYSYTKSYNGNVINHIGVFHSKNNNNIQQYIFKNVYRIEPNMNMDLGQVTYATEPYPTNFVEIPNLDIQPIIGPNAIRPPPAIPGGRSRKTKNRKSKKRTNRRRRGTRKH